MPFNNPVVAAVNLIRQAIQSPNFVSGTSGWQIAKDGSAEFSEATIRGDFLAGDNPGAHVEINEDGMFVYDEDNDLILRISTNLLFAVFSISGGIVSISPANGLLLGYEDVFTPVKLYNGLMGGLTTGGIPGGLLAYASSTAATAGITATETKDGGCGDIDFEAIEDRRYSLYYRARAQTTATATAIMFRIRDGGAASPTNASTILAASQCVPSATGGAGDELIVQRLLRCPDNIAAGTHTLAAFYSRPAGAGTVSASQSLIRELWVKDEG